MTNKHSSKEYTTGVAGENIQVTQINNDVDGNPRYVVHYVDLGIKSADYGKIPGLTKYRAKWFGGGYVFQAFGSNDVIANLQWMLSQVESYYIKKGGK